MEKCIAEETARRQNALQRRLRVVTRLRVRAHKTTQKRLSTKNKNIHRPWQRDLRMQGGVSSLEERRTADASDPRTLVPVLGFRVYGLRW